MQSSEHVYCVAIAFKMTEQVQQTNLLSSFVLGLNSPPLETIWMIQKATAMGKW